MKKSFIMFCMSILVVGYALPTLAGMKIGGIIFTDVYYEFRDKENSGTDDDAALFNLKVPNITRLYGKWSNENKDVGMWIEFGIDGNGIGKRNVVTRHACGWWQVNPHLKITAGQTVTGFSPLNPQQLLGTNSLNLNVVGGGFGDVYAGRVPQVRFTLTPDKAFQIDVAFSEPDITSAVFDDVIDSWGDKDSSFPRVDISAIIKAGPLTLYPGVMYANKTFSVDDEPEGADDSITTYIISLGAKSNFGPVCLQAEFNVGQNWGNQDFVAVGLEHSLSNNSKPDKKNYGGALAIGDNKIENTEMYGGWVDAGITVGPAEIHAIMGIQNYANDMTPNDTKDDFSQTVRMFGFSIPVKVAKNFKIRPEIMYYDLGKRENFIKDDATGSFEDEERGSYVIAGAQFQITF